MKISELIAELDRIKSECGDLQVLVDGYEDGFNDPGKPNVQAVRPVETEWWSGDYQEASSYDSREAAAKAFAAVVIPR